ncbi:MAG: 5-(carboxyamino)imidazole ribonucleotide synthase [Chloroflexota bacterium]|nr:5-(carboxyamino)imidazole ribonucleotide synthase [Chloroflexota bacterium]
MIPSDPDSFPRTVGIVGAGQLARMMLQAAIPLGVRVQLLAERADDGAALVAPDVTLGRADDPAALVAFVAGCDATTFDHELVDAGALTALEAAGHALRPGAGTVALAQNKRRQRQLLGSLGFPVPPHRPVDAPSDLVEFGSEYGWPVVAKAGRGGYDGRGVWVLDGPAAAMEFLARVDPVAVELLVEAWVPIERELAVLVARRPTGEVVTYPPVETVQVEGICHEILVPAPVASGLVADAERLALAIATSIESTGVLAVELFQMAEGLVVNELAARPHNSGHWTIEGATTSQFEQHLRAVLDWPLGSTALRAPAVATVNVLGRDEVDPVRRLPAALAVDGVHVHLYGKAARPGRKLGHVTALGQDPAEVRDRAVRAAELLAGAVPAGSAS